jgi:serine protease Do
LIMNKLRTTCIKYLLLAALVLANKTIAAEAKQDINQGFSSIVEPLMPAVVNITTIEYANQNNNNSPFRQHFNSPHGSLFDEFFEEFFSGPGGRFGGPRGGGNQKSMSMGSGFVIDSKGYIATNHHVIADADEIKVKMSDNKEYTAKVVGTDPSTDLALLKIDSDKELSYVEFGNSEMSKIGDWVIAIGNPFSLGSTVTTGIVSASGRDVNESANGLVHDFIQIDAALNRGNSGGPLFNLQGQVIGINNMIYSPSGGNVGIGFAIPSNTAKNTIKQLKEQGYVDRGSLGVRIQAINEEMAESLGLKEAKGAMISEIMKDSAAEKAGLEVGDLIIGYNDSKVDSARDLQILVAGTKGGTKVKLTLMRNGRKTDKTVTIQSKEPTKVAKKQESKRFEDSDSKEFHGLTLSNITPKIQKYFNIKPDLNGVVVTEISNKSTWGSKGIIKGDVITAINQISVSSVEEFEKQYNQSLNAKKKHVLLQITRGNSIIFLPVPTK